MNEAGDWTFSTRRLRARLVDERDRALYRALYSDAGVMAHVGTTLDPDAVDALFAKVCRANAKTSAMARYWRVDAAGADDPIGQVSMIRVADDPRCADLGVMLLPRWQNRGVGLSALAGLVDALLSERWPLGLETLTARHAADNPNAGRLTGALGFVVASADEAEVLWRLDRRDWPQVRACWPAAALGSKRAAAGIAPDGQEDAA